MPETHNRIKVMYEADRARVYENAEKRIRQLSYEFAMSLKSEFRFGDLEKTINDLALNVRALGLVESGFDDIVSEQPEDDEINMEE